MVHKIVNILSNSRGEVQPVVRKTTSRTAEATTVFVKSKHSWHPKASSCLSRKVCAMPQFVVFTFTIARLDLSALRMRGERFLQIGENTGCLYWVQTVVLRTPIAHHFALFSRATRLTYYRGIRKSNSLSSLVLQAFLVAVNEVKTGWWKCWETWIRMVVYGTQASLKKNIKSRKICTRLLFVWFPFCIRLLCSPIKCYVDIMPISKTV